MNKSKKKQFQLRNCVFIKTIRGKGVVVVVVVVVVVGTAVNRENIKNNE